MLRPFFVFLLLAASSTPALCLSTPDVAPTQSASDTLKADPSVEELERQGDLLRAQNDNENARKLYEKALKKAPKAARLWNKLGVIALQARDYNAAQYQFAQAARLDKHLSEAFNNLGVVYYFKKDWPRAAAQYRKAIEIADSASYHSNLGAVYFEMNDAKAAVEEYRRAVELDPQVLERTSSTGVSAHAGNSLDRARYAFLMSRLYAKLGDVDRSLSQLKNAVDNGFRPAQDFSTDADFTAVRQDPRFAEIMNALQGQQ